MSKPLRFGHAVSLAVLAAVLASCAASQQKTGFGGKAEENVGLATRALLALNGHNFPIAIDFAERAVEKSPGDAGFRALLGNAYFAAGRFRSAEAAYKDSLSIYSNQPQVILKLALAETALGKKAEAVAFLEAGKSVLDPSDFGLALALAGQPSEAIPVLDGAARAPGADATVRQNLALAHALAGDWTEARTIAEQDVPANALEARMNQWMQLANPKTSSTQVAALLGVTPASTDAGEPIRLALRKTDTMMAEAAPAPVRTAQKRLAAPVKLAAEQKPAEVAPVAPPVAVQPKVVEAVAASPEPAPATVIPAVAKVVKPVAKPIIAEAAVPTPVAMISAAAIEASTVAAHKLASAIENFVPKFHATHTYPARRHLFAAVHAARRSGPVIQLGAYRSPQFVSTAWSALTKRHPVLRAYLPLRARFVSPKGIFWRLSIQGFGSEHEAQARCQLLKSRGGSCFVRGIAGDAPIQFASR